MTAIVVLLPRVLKLAEVLVESVVALTEELLVPLEPRRDVSQRLGLQPAGTPLRLATLLDEAGSLEHLQVLRDRRQAHIERRRQVAHRRLAVGKSGDDRPTG